MTLAAEDTVNIKLLVVNPSESKKLATEVSHLLPPEIQPEHILDKAEMDLVYDQENNAYRATKKVILDPKETRTMNLKVRNVWVIPDDMISKVREQLEKDLKALEGTKYYETAKLLHEKAITRLDQIEAERNEKGGIRRQIELYRAHRRQLPEIQNGIVSMTALQRMEATGGQDVRTVKFMVNANNPSDQPLKMMVRAELPKEIKAQDVVDKKDFILLFDDQAGRFALEKQDQFSAKEAKSYEIVLRDIWYIPETELNIVREQTAKLLELFKNSDYAAYASEGSVYINTLLDEISQIQAVLAADGSVEDRIRTFVLNKQKYQLARGKMQELQDLLLELPLKSEENVIQKIMRGIAEIQRVEDVTKILSMGIDPEISTTWWIIFGIIIFLAIIAVSFYVTWLTKLNQMRKKEQTAAK